MGLQNHEPAAAGQAGTSRAPLRAVGCGWCRCPSGRQSTLCVWPARPTAGPACICSSQSSLCSRGMHRPCQTRARCSRWPALQYNENESSRADIFKEIDILIALKHDNIVFMKGTASRGPIGVPAPAARFGLVGARAARWGDAGQLWASRLLQTLRLLRRFAAEYFEENNKVYLIMEMLEGEGGWREACTASCSCSRLEPCRLAAARMVHAS